jgi:hypothetical protein
MPKVGEAERAKTAAIAKAAEEVRLKAEQDAKVAAEKKAKEEKLAALHVSPTNPAVVGSA